MVWKKNQDVFDHSKIFGEFAEDNRKSQSRSPRKIEDEHVKYILVKLIKTDHYHWTLIKSELNIDVGNTIIVEIK